MTYPSTTKDAFLNGLTITAASLHTAFPGTIGSNELSGGAPAYARLAITIAASSGGTRALSNPAAFNVPATTIRWIGFFNGTVFVACAPNGGATPKSFVLTGSTIYSTGHGYSNGQKVVFYNGSPPAGVTEGAVYYVVGVTTDSLQVSATLNGSSLTLSGSAGFGCVLTAITEAVYTLQDTHTLTTATFTIPD